MLKIPKKIKIGGLVYDIVKVDEITVQDTPVAGSISPSRQEIQLETGYKDNFSDTVFLHEILHGIAYHTGRMDLFEDESIIDCFANGLTALINDNKGILAT